MKVLLILLTVTISLSAQLLPWPIRLGSDTKTETPQAEVQMAIGFATPVQLQSELQPAATCPGWVSFTAGQALTNIDIAKLKAVGFADDAIIAQIKSSPGNYNLEPQALAALKRRLSKAVIAAMAKRQRSVAAVTSELQR